MIVVLASKTDRAARNLVSQWSSSDALMLTPSDLSLKGWKQYSGSPRESVAVIGGTQVSNAEVSGIVVRLPYVPEAELTSITPGDRTYVAAEMTSFLVWWLSRLECPKFNPPTATNLLGPNWSQAEWLHVAKSHGLTVQDSTKSGNAFPPHLQCVTLVGGNFIEEDPGTISEGLRRLARFANVNYLRFWLTSSDGSPKLVGVDSSVDIASGHITEAILQQLV